jgi:hypothetical protein
MTPRRKTPRKTAPVPSDGRRPPRRGEHRESAGAPDTLPPELHTTRTAGDLAHFLDGLRCPTCRALNASWLTGDGTAVECAECGQISLVVGPGEVA